MKKGSALLIVLGMLSFMVISAVAFSAYMRHSRLPSSYLRRTSSSRQLVKAALAEAIDIVDAAVADNPHPGVGKGSIMYPRAAGTTDPNRNSWRNHVFIGSNNLVSAADTISTLTLEGLAYLPPALINEARYYSRHSLAAMWHSFGYDCGRYAFCAVDVSDHFDINKIPADAARGSSPENRLSLSYVFENTSHTGYTLQPSAWDQFMENYVSFAAVKDDIKTPAQKGSSGGGSSGGSSSSKLPLVSLADFNLAVYDKLGSLSSYLPFASVLGGGASEFVTSPTGPIAEMQRHMAFITDSYFPSAAGTSDSDDYDLADEQYQPFDESALEANNSRIIGRILDESSKGAVRLRNAIGRLGLVHLFDYLDKDDVPVSLAIPSVERAPMVCGISHTINGSMIEIKSKDEDPTGNQLGSVQTDIVSPNYVGAQPSSMRITPTAPGLKRTAQYVTKHFIDGTKFLSGIRTGAIKALVAYPFRRGIDLKNPDSFNIDGHVEFFFTVGNFTFRTGNQNDALHMAGGNSALTSSAYNNNGVFHFPLAQQNCDFNNVDQESDAVKEVDFTLRDGVSSIQNVLNDNPFILVTWEQDQESWEPDPINSPGVYAWRNTSSGPRRVGASCAIPPLAPNGEPDPRFTSMNSFLSYLNSGGTEQITLRMAVWLRVKNGDGKTVDLVPATMLDDREFNGRNNYASGSARVLGDAMGSAYPVMRFNGSAPFAFNDQPMASPVAIDVAPKGILCGDPRWNWAPEHWFINETVSKDEWLNKCGKGVDGRDSDIFMATSDSGYMQSAYELAFLPRLCGSDFANLGNELYGQISSLQNSSLDQWPTQVSSCDNWHRMWRTYYPFGNAPDDFVTLGQMAGFVNDGGGPKINPYSDNANIIVAAFANTPESWWSASANTDDTGISASERKATTFNKKYAFSAMNPDAKFAWQDLKNIASAFVSQMRNQTHIDGWMDAYDDLWDQDGTNGDTLMGVTLEGDTDDLYGVDRKFLYGYWRDCFAVKQQLFLIFVRAEPMMMGGGAIGQTPPQLGARAVALVWRNPYPGSKPYSSRSASGETGSSASSSIPPNAPHQTRVLMYRQFD
ncbi:MAG: hypothetical protein J6R80_04255 [Kiritimatiellae bacterium]|nr:hypothetical protein [Kiritimatiellia bacterium]